MRERNLRIEFFAASLSRIFIVTGLTADCGASPSYIAGMYKNEIGCAGGISQSRNKFIRCFSPNICPLPTEQHDIKSKKSILTHFLSFFT